MPATPAPSGPPRVPWWRSEQARGIVFQGAAVALVLGLLGWGAWNAAVNLRALNIASGFGFLGEPAGYDISFSLISYELTDTHGRVFLVGLINTLFVAGLGIVLATVLGVMVGLLRLSGNWIVARLTTTYVEVVRNVPLLLQILFWYALLLTLPTVRESLSLGDVVFLNNRGLELPRPGFGPGMDWVLVAAVIGVGAAVGLRRAGQSWAPVLGAALVPPLVVFAALGAPLTWEVPALQRFRFEGGVTVPPSFVALLLALTTYTAAFIGEIVRSGVMAVDRGQREAARALGLSPGQETRLVVLPQALRVIVPPVTSQYLNLTKNSSLGIVIGYPDLVATFGGTTLNQTGQAIETLLLVMAFYLTVSLLISFAMNLYNRAIRLKGG